MGWKRSGHVNLFVDYQVLPVEKKTRIIDMTTNKVVPAQVLNRRSEGAYWVLEVSDIPAMGYKALTIEATAEEPVTAGETNTETLENKYYKIIINKTEQTVYCICFRLDHLQGYFPDIFFVFHLLHQISCFQIEYLA